MRRDREHDKKDAGEEKGIEEITDFREVQMLRGRVKRNVVKGREVTGALREERYRTSRID